MTTRNESVRTSNSPAWPKHIAALSVLWIAVLLAYSNASQGVFVWDDHHSILGNETLKKLDSWQVVSPPRNGTTVSGRPVLNLSLAIDYHFNRLNPTGYHYTNIAIHILNASLIFGLLTLIPRSYQQNESPTAFAIVFATTLIWSLHPLQTESVTYIIQRAESLSTLLYLATIYFVLLGFKFDSKLALGAACVTSALGMGTKEIVFTAPLMVLIADRLLFHDKFIVAVRNRPVFYLCLFSTCLIVPFCSYALGGRGKTAGLGTGISPLLYFLSQFYFIGEYIKHSFWPRGLVFEYGTALVTDPGKLLQGTLVIAVATGIVIYYCTRNAALLLTTIIAAFILGPSSSLIPIATQIAAEHRFYFPLLPLTFALVLLLNDATTQLFAERSGNRWLLFWLIVTAVSASLAFGTYERNKIYHSRIALWTNAIESYPSNPRAVDSLTLVLNDYGNIAKYERRWNDAIEYYRQSLRADFLQPEIHNDLGLVLIETNDRKAALAHFTQALELDPKLAEAWVNLGNLVYPADKLQALEFYRTALRVRPNYEAALRNIQIIEQELSQDRSPPTR